MKAWIPFWAVLLVGAIAVFMAVEAVNGWRTGKVAFALRAMSLGPFDRHSQPVRYWLALSWCSLLALAATILFVLALVGTITGDVVQHREDAMSTFTQ